MVAIVIRLMPRQRQKYTSRSVAGTVSRSSLLSSWELSGGYQITSRAVCFLRQHCDYDLWSQNQGSSLQGEPSGRPIGVDVDDLFDHVRACTQ